MKRRTDNGVMIMSDRTNYRSALLAALVACVLMLACGIAQRLLADQWAGVSTRTPIPSGLLERLPMQIGEWSGKDMPLDQAIVRATDTDTSVNRLYSHSQLGSASLFVGCGTRTRELMVHRPEVCYIGAGWTRTARHLRKLPLANGESLPCALLEFSRGVEKILALHYYIVDGQYCDDVSEWLHHFWSVGYVANIQIVVSSEGLTADRAEKIVSELAKDSASKIIGLFAHLHEGKSADASEGIGE